MLYPLSPYGGSQWSKPKANYACRTEGAPKRVERVAFWRETFLSVPLGFVHELDYQPEASPAFFVRDFSVVYVKLSRMLFIGIMEMVMLRI